MDDGDLRGWQELSGFAASTSDEVSEPDQSLTNIGRVLVEGDTFCYNTCDSGEVKVQQEPEKGLSFQIWPSSLTLVRYAEERQRLQRGCWKASHVLEIGCGCGLVGLVLASLGAHVALTDLPQTMALLQRNIELNDSLIRAAGGSAMAFPLVWGETDCSTLPSEWQRPDFVLAADVVYHRELFSKLLDALDCLAQDARTAVILAHVRRWKSDKTFFAKARKLFTIEDITSQVGGEFAAADAQASHTKGASRLYHLSRAERHTGTRRQRAGIPQ